MGCSIRTKRLGMKRVIGIYLVLMTLGFISCSGKDELWVEETVRLSVSAPVFDAEVHSRTSMTGSKAAFTAGDRVGVFETLTGSNNVAFLYDGTLWGTTTPVYWRNNTSIHTFFAYYPYTVSSQGLSVAIPVLNQQKVSTVPDAACDMLVTPVATTQTRSSSTSVGLTMSHNFALLRFDIKMSVLSLLNPYVLDSLIVRGGNAQGGTGPYGMFNTTNDINRVSYNLSSKSFNLSPNNSTTCSQVLRVAPPSVNIQTTAVSVYVLILPGEYENPSPAINLKLSTLGILPKNTGFLVLPGSASFKAGSMYVYQVSVGLNLLGGTKAGGGENEPVTLSVAIDRWFP